ncbi:MAG: DUF4837 family protein [candidate division KSB1 bacterium]|nr:DUF4837 family protein [candidate division KSB1 bacterium]MDZ7366758.1 DUF4837 family protein [candidate division KSB1 bacterium]MDZ7404770.1 DUF4837 family protein [candidate division KSB1 bacterium]
MTRFEGWKMRKIFLLLITVVFIFFCQREIPSSGNEKEIIVIADSLDYAFLQEELSRTFEREVATPWPEKIFELKPISADQMENYFNHPQLLLIGILDRATPAASRVKSMLAPEVAERIRNGQNYVLQKDEPWAEDQRLVVLCAAHLDTLKQRISSHRDELFSMFDQFVAERMQREMYSQFERKELAATLLEKYGWTLRIQHDYHLYKEFPLENFVMLRRSWPERWLFVSWEKLNDSKPITPDEIVAWRNRIGERFYEGDKIVDNELTFHQVDFAGYRALEAQGLWENEKKVAGGPFKAWAFYDDSTQQAFLIDIAVFAPGKEKVKFLRQLEIMARTFETR